MVHDAKTSSELSKNYWFCKCHGQNIKILINIDVLTINIYDDMRQLYVSIELNLAAANHTCMILNTQPSALAKVLTGKQATISHTFSYMKCMN